MLEKRATIDGEGKRQKGGEGERRGKWENRRNSFFFNKNACLKIVIIKKNRNKIIKK